MTDLKEYMAEGDIEVTDEMIDQWEEEIEQGIPADELGEFIVRKPILGRPRLYSESMSPVTFRLPDNEIDALHQAAASHGMSFSNFMRQICEQALTDDSYCEIDS